MSPVMLPAPGRMESFTTHVMASFTSTLKVAKLKLELTSKGLNTEKFRKATVKSEEHAINKVLEWMGKIAGDSFFLA